MFKCCVLVVICLLAFSALKLHTPGPMPVQPLEIPGTDGIDVGPYQLTKQKPSADSEDQTDLWYIKKENRD